MSGGDKRGSRGPGALEPGTAGQRTFNPWARGSTPPRFTTFASSRNLRRTGFHFAGLRFETTSINGRARDS